MNTTAASWMHSAAIGGCVRKQDGRSLRMCVQTGSLPAAQFAEYAKQEQGM